MPAVPCSTTGRGWPGKARPSCRTGNFSGFSGEPARKIYWISQHLVASKKETEKVNKYRDHVEQRGYAFTPFGLETYGSWGPRAKDVLDRLVAHAEACDLGDTRPHYAWVAQHIRDAAQQLVGVALMKGIARSLHTSALRRARPTPHDVDDYIDRAFSQLSHHAPSSSSAPLPRGRSGSAPMAREAVIPPGTSPFSHTSPHHPPPPPSSRAPLSTNPSCEFVGCGCPRDST